ncbi:MULTISPECIES: hypothetical protein [Sphingobacterium]|uniref:hypothetical protein n=1 Tax=Sphingobacterium TaxID=28453 RepID=UPI0013DBEBE7|nr:MULTISPECIES: hypothetical protein [unclassified Sphingobacterium]
MKYLVIENKAQEESEWVYDIADFFWNNGNQVYIGKNYSSMFEYKNIVEYCDCIVLINDDCPTELLFESKQENFCQYFDLKNVNEKKTALIFSIDGVYSNVIPFPHKIFHYDQLSQNELTRFFNWCRKLNLFK